MAETPKWYDLAFADRGTKEGPGGANNPRVVAYYRDAGFPGVKNDSVAWCAAFVGAMLRRSGIKGSGSLAARSYLNWGKKLSKPQIGCIAVFSRGKPGQGHVAFYAGPAGAGKIKVLGGNQSDAVTLTTRTTAQLLGYRWPATAPAEPITPPPAPEGPKMAIIRRGAKGDAVKEIQTLLVKHGIELEKIDGDFGPGTQMAVNAFQQARGLTLDGEVGPDTIKALRAPVAAKKSVPLLAPALGTFSPSSTAVAADAATANAAMQAAMQPERNSEMTQTTTVPVVPWYASKINWVSIVGVVAQVGNFLGVVSLDPETQLQIAAGLGALQGLVTGVLKTWTAPRAVSSQLG